mmetsp:Transcript_28461/g.68389  ORF Transcript_28461/g.68389 Transcript_28461/m.68389 type:complete len:251 (-) Transcript_28461:62-814(-)
MLVALRRAPNPRIEKGYEVGIYNDHFQDARNDTRENEQARSPDKTTAAHIQRTASPSSKAAHNVDCGVDWKHVPMADVQVLLHRNCTVSESPHSQRSQSGSCTTIHSLLTPPLSFFRALPAGALCFASLLKPDPTQRPEDRKQHYPHWRLDEHRIREKGPPTSCTVVAVKKRRPLLSAEKSVPHAIQQTLWEEPPIAAEVDQKRGSPFELSVKPPKTLIPVALPLMTFGVREGRIAEEERGPHGGEGCGD